MQCDLHRYPKDFNAQHAELSQRIRIRQDAEKAAQLKAFVATLARYRFQSSGLVLRPLADTAEVIQEGTALHHCVGSYAQRYAEGKTVLCCLRRIDTPDTPLYTVEFTPAGKGVQCRGDHNQTAKEDEPVLEQFWALFEKHFTWVSSTEALVFEREDRRQTLLKSTHGGGPRSSTDNSI